MSIKMLSVLGEKLALWIWDNYFLKSHETPPPLL